MVKKKRKTLAQILEFLKKPFVPRAGVIPGRIFKDKSKYNRKDKHKKDYKNED